MSAIMHIQGWKFLSLLNFHDDKLYNVKHDANRPERSLVRFDRINEKY